MSAGLPRATLLLDRRQVAGLIGLEATIPAVEAAFAEYARGGLAPPGVLAIPGAGGGLHVKAASMSGPEPWIAVKLNSNFPANTRRYGLPTIQGTIALFDGASGFPLAVMDSIEITILRTAAATAVAARWLAREDADSITICGCGTQALAQLRAVAAVRPLRRVFLYDLDPGQAARLARMVGSDGREAIPVTDLRRALDESLLVVTCTPSRKAILGIGDVIPGAFVAAVGADSEEKQELDARLVAAATLVVDLLEPCAMIGELHHALDAGLMSREDVHAELGQIVAGLRPGRRSADEIVVFDSTGTALQDAAAARLAYERALEAGVGTWFDFASSADLA
jgi:ornithine cyclodeaminase/alanine dehydrogenase-like protein (mu-crystallin family)